MILIRMISLVISLKVRKLSSLWGMYFFKEVLLLEEIRET